jgi:hypothetical protein
LTAIDPQLDRNDTGRTRERDEELSDLHGRVRDENAPGPHAVDDGRKFLLGGDEDWQSRAGRGAREPGRERLVRTEEVVGQHNRTGRRLERVRGALRALNEIGRRGSQAERAHHANRLAAQDTFDDELSRLPVGRVGEFELRRDEIEGRKELTRRRDEPAAAGARDHDAFRSDARAAQEHGERRRARLRGLRGDRRRN